jgi:hypothetical protein
MKENRVIWIFLIVTQFAFSQIRGVVKDSISGEPIPYVNIWVENETIGTTSETNGSFSLDLKEEKVLVFSALGYEVKKASSKSEVILLKPKVFELKEVVIEQPKFKKEIEIGTKLQKTSVRISDQVGNLKGRYFAFKEEYKNSKFIRNIRIFTDSKVNNSKFKIRVLSVDINGFPDSDILNEDLIITVKKGKRENIINLQDYNLIFPENGIFVVFETLFLNENKITYKSYNQFTKQNQQVSRYEPGLVCNLVDEENTYIFTSKGWYKFPKQPNNQKGSFTKLNNKIFEPAITLTLTN